MSIDQASEKMRGGVNTPVKLSVTRGRPDSITTLEIMRGAVTIKSVRSEVKNGDIGYIRILQFTGRATSGLRAAVDAIRAAVGEDQLKGYVVDLRNNPGGFVTDAIDTVNAFVDSGEIVATRGRNSGANREFFARPGENISGHKPLVVLVNGGTASAAEIVAGALQDLKRGIIIGTRSYGKGSVQTTIPFGEDAALYLTTARYFTHLDDLSRLKGSNLTLRFWKTFPVALTASILARERLR